MVSSESKQLTKTLLPPIHHESSISKQQHEPASMNHIDEIIKEGMAAGKGFVPAGSQPG